MNPNTHRAEGDLFWDDGISIGTILNYFSDNKKDKKIGLTEIKPEIKTNINPVINPVKNINVNFG